MTVTVRCAMVNRTASGNLETGFGIGAGVVVSTIMRILKMELVDSIMAFEGGQLDTMGTIKLFSGLVKSGQAWSLQGSYGRAAAALIERGILSKDGEIDYELLDELMED